MVNSARAVSSHRLPWHVCVCVRELTCVRGATEELAENIAFLRGLVPQLDETDWMFDKS